MIKLKFEPRNNGADIPRLIRASDNHYAQECQITKYGDEWGMDVTNFVTNISNMQKVDLSEVLGVKEIDYNKASFGIVPINYDLLKVANFDDIYELLNKVPLYVAYMPLQDRLKVMAEKGELSLYEISKIESGIETGKNTIIEHNKEQNLPEDKVTDFEEQAFNSVSLHTMRTLCEELESSLNLSSQMNRY